MKDYYQILGVTADFDSDEIRQKYRKLAMQHHPDRNPDDPEAEVKFKEIAEAYGVLTDPVKRKQYDAARSGFGRWSENGSDGGFNYSQEDILKDLFRDPRFQQMFGSLLRDFQSSGFRASHHFIRKSFFGGKGGMLIGGLFLFGSLAGPALLKSAKNRLPKKASMLGNVKNAVSSLLSSTTASDTQQETAPGSRPEDVTYITPLTALELEQGKTIQVVAQGPDGQEMLRVKIPPASRDGQKLRIRGKGGDGLHHRGDLYLQLKCE